MAEYSFTASVASWLLWTVWLASSVGGDDSGMDQAHAQLDSDLFGLLASGRLAALSDGQKRELVSVMLASTPDDSLTLAREIVGGGSDGFESLTKLANDLKAVTAIGCTGMDGNNALGFCGSGTAGGARRGGSDAIDGSDRQQPTSAAEDAAEMSRKSKAKIRMIMKIASDTDCTEKEFDLQHFAAKPFSESNVRLLNDITDTFAKCGMVVLRNAFPPTETAKFVRDYSQYVRGLQSGRISHNGTTTNGEPFFAFKLDSKRWDLLMPRELARPGMLLSAIVNMFFQQDRILGKEFAVHSLGSVLGMPGAPAMKWHRDAPALFEDLFPQTKGRVFMSDLPPHSVTMIMPMLNMTHDHGPTEFCMGSAQMLEEVIDLVDLAAEFGEASAADLDALATYLKCPTGHRRAPVTSPGDAVLFDFRTKHRVLPNKSNQTRALMYWGFSRQWYKDHNYLQARAFSADGGERLLVPRDSARGSAFDRKMRRQISKQVKDIEKERFKAWASQAKSARYSRDKNGRPIRDENGNPLEEDGPEVHEPWLYNRRGVVNSVGITPPIAHLNDLLKSARFAVPARVGCEGMVNDEACGPYQEIEAALPRKIVDMQTVLTHNPARKSIFQWYEDIDGDGALTDKDYGSQKSKVGDADSESFGDMDEASFKQLRIIADADWNGKVTWDELQEFDQWNFNHPQSQEMDFPTAVRNRARFRETVDWFSEEAQSVWAGAAPVQEKRGRHNADWSTPISDRGEL